MQPLTLAFFGISGSGKGTQAKLLIDRLKETDPTRTTMHAEMGNYLREYTKEETMISGHVKEVMLAGGLVPSFVAIYMLSRDFDKNVKGDEHFIFDGTCRRPEQSVAVDEISRFFGRTDMHIISLNLTKESAKQRLIARGRADDASDDSLNQRFGWYTEHVIPSMHKLRDLGWTLHEIDGEPDTDTIHKNILSTLKLT